MVKWSVIGSICGLIWIIVGVILGWNFIPSIIYNKISDNIAIINGTDQFRRWVKVPQPILLKIYIFHVLNPDEIHNGLEKPNVIEIGPYVYKQYRQKYNVTFLNDGKTVSYEQQQNYVFDKEASGNLTENDEIVVLNVPMNSVFQMAEKSKQMSMINLAANEIFNNQTTLFIKTTVRELLFDGILFCNNVQKLNNNIAKVICNQMLKEKITTISKTPEGYIKFAFFHHKATKPDGKYEIFTGIENIRETTVIRNWNGKSELDTWSRNSTCNKIAGSDGITYPPFQKPEGFITSFITDICRSVDVHFDKEIDFKGITGYRFTPRGSFLNEIGPEFSNDCYCTNEVQHELVQENGCLYSGALDLSNCLRAPIILTNPHMFNASTKYTSLINGLKPVREQHLTFLEMEPKTGTPLRGSKRVQFNMLLRKIESITITKNYKTILMPILWLEEGIELNDKMVNLLNKNLFNVLRNAYTGVWILIVIGFFIFVGFTLHYLYYRKYATEKFS